MTDAFLESDLFARAAAFIWKNARLLDRRRFAFLFLDGDRESVLHALLAYRNDDGGFGNALEPDIRCPESQPVPTQHALEILDEVGGEPVLAHRICDYLESITLPAGGVPFVLPSVRAHPRAPWWQPADPLVADLNPTAAIAGLLHKLGVDHPWLARATDFCWRTLPDLDPTDVHAARCVITFLEHVPDRARADAALSQVAGAILRAGVVAAADVDGYVFKALDWAPLPDHPLRRFIPPEQVAADVTQRMAGQQADGGWTIPWPPLSPGCEIEWRGWVTVNLLKSLRAEHGAV